MSIYGHLQMLLDSGVDLSKHVGGQGQSRQAIKLFQITPYVMISKH